ncbi:MAG: SPFH domain-containing protein [Methylococcaceae bacterium]|nr:SPFH domain-containing protein [Methylococcaceae bacterium]
MNTFIVCIIFISIALFFLPFRTVKEGNVAVVTLFGRYRRVLKPGLNWLWPWEFTTMLSMQSQVVDMEFHAITKDQANVEFNCTLLFEVANIENDTVRRAMFSFANTTAFMLSMRRLVEDETRSYAAGKRQAELIGMSQEVVTLIRQNVEVRLAEWGYRIIELRYHNLSFDKQVMDSMTRVVAAINEREAAEHEGQALLIRKTKNAEANGAFIAINAEAERVALKLRGQGLAEFRREVASGVHDAVEELTSAGVDPNYLLFFMYTESLKHIAENSKAGSTIFVNTHPSMPKDIMENMATFYRNTGVSQESTTVGGVI